MGKKMLFRDLEDCDLCPFNRDNEKKYRSEYFCSGDPNHSHPCEWMDDYGDMTLQEVTDAVNAKIYAAEAYYEKQWLAKKAKEDKNKELAKKREQTRSANYQINREITRLRKLIRDRENAIQSLSALHSAFGFANAMMEGRDPNTVPVENEQVCIWKQANIRDKQILEELLKERDRRNRERRNSSKE